MEKMTVDFRFNSGASIYATSSSETLDDYASEISFFDDSDTCNPFSATYSVGEKYDLYCPGLCGALAEMRLKWSVMFGDRPFEYVYDADRANRVDGSDSIVSDIFSPVEGVMARALAGGFDAKFYAGFLNAHVKPEYIEFRRSAPVLSYDSVFAISGFETDGLFVEMRSQLNICVRYGAGGAVVDERTGWRRNAFPAPVTVAFRFRETGRALPGAEEGRRFAI